MVGLKESFVIKNAKSKLPLLFVCDHASSTVPEQYNLLGLAASVFNQHVAIDVGARDVADALGDYFSATVVSSVYSRLLVDLNRFPEHSSWIPEISDGLEIPGNRNLDEVERNRRAQLYFWPYQNAVSRAVDNIVARGQTPVIVSVHSFTPALRNGNPRPWHYGVLWSEDNRLAAPLITTLRENPALCIGDNEPYHANKPMGFTAKTHAEDRGFPHALIEIRQDLIDSDSGVEFRAREFGDALQCVLDDTHHFQGAE